MTPDRFERSVQTTLHSGGGQAVFLPAKCLWVWRGWALGLQVFGAVVRFGGELEVDGHFVWGGGGMQAI